MVLVTETEVLEILKRAQSGGESVSAFESESSVREEVNRRTFKAGYTDSEGGPPSSGKGDTPRPCNTKRFGENYVKIFGHN